MSTHIISIYILLLLYKTEVKIQIDLLTPSTVWRRSYTFVIVRQNMHAYTIHKYRQGATV